MTKQTERPTPAKTTPTDPVLPITATPRPTKLARLVDLLVRPEGASLSEMCATTGWQAHSVRGALAGALRKKGHEIRSEKTDGERRYRIGGGS